MFECQIDCLVLSRCASNESNAEVFASAHGSSHKGTYFNNNNNKYSTLHRGEAKFSHFNHKNSAPFNYGAKAKCPACCPGLPTVSTM